MDNFQISGVPVSRHSSLVVAIASVKQAAAIANHEIGLLSRVKMSAVVSACEEIRRGGLHEHFVVDVIQGGAGTSTNMNANEVIANRALELMGRKKGEYRYLHPLEHVNMSQSTNDVYPTAVKLAAYEEIGKLLVSMAGLRRAFEIKAREFDGILKIGRTQLQEAVPMTLGQEFLTYAIMIEEDESRLREVCELISEINLGATAIGTGINTPQGYAKVVCSKLKEITGIPVITARNLIEATQDCGSFVQLSSVLKRIAVKISKVCNDLRLLSSGPRAGFNEINLPAVQAGSSIMPGKVNPVIPEVVNQVAFEVIGNDLTVTMAAEAGQLQLNAFEPIIAHSILKSISHLRCACDALSGRCVRGITANRDVLQRQVRASIGLATALNPHIGYEMATAIAKEALRTGDSVINLAIKRKIMTRRKLGSLLKPEILTRPAKKAV